MPKAAPGRDYVLRFTSQQHYEQLTGRLRMLREWRVRSTARKVSPAQRSSAPPCRAAV